MRAAHNDQPSSEIHVTPIKSPRLPCPKARIGCEPKGEGMTRGGYRQDRIDLIDGKARFDCAPYLRQRRKPRHIRERPGVDRRSEEKVNDPAALAAPFFRLSHDLNLPGHHRRFRDEWSIHHQ